MRRGSPSTRILSVGSSEEYGVVAAGRAAAARDQPPCAARARTPSRASRRSTSATSTSVGFGLDIVATRSFNHVGAGQRDQFVVSALAKQFAELAKGTRAHLDVGTTSVVRDFLDVRDVVTAYGLLLARGVRGEVYNVCSGRGVSIAEAIAIFEEITGLHPQAVTDPARVRPVENALVVGSNAKIIDAVGWRPTHTIEDALRSVYEYWSARV